MAKTVKVKASIRNGKVVKAHTRTVGSSTAKRNVTELDKKLKDKHFGLKNKKVGDHLASLNGEDHNYAGYKDGKHYAVDGLGRKKEIISSQSIGIATYHKMRLAKNSKGKKHASFVATKKASRKSPAVRTSEEKAMLKADADSRKKAAINNRPAGFVPTKKSKLSPARKKAMRVVAKTKKVN